MKAGCGGRSRGSWTNCRTRRCLLWPQSWLRYKPRKKRSEFFLRHGVDGGIDFFAHGLSLPVQICDICLYLYTHSVSKLHERGNL
nr:MAG TPA: hypothetical protein [Caudoviricetes sp.]